MAFFTNTPEEQLEKITRVVKNLVYLAGLLMAICGSIVLTIDRTFEAKVNQLNRSFDTRIVRLETYTNNQIEKNVMKQADKIQSQNFADLKKSDIEDALKYYPMLENPSQECMLAYEIVKTYYTEKGASTRASTE